MKKLSLILAAGLFFAAQTSQGEWVTFNALPMPQELKLQVGAEPAMLPSLLNAAIFPQQVESKELWVGDKTLSFHITARESLQTAYGSNGLAALTSRIWNELKMPLMRSLLLAVTRESKTEPIQRNFGALRQLARSA